MEFSVLLSVYDKENPSFFNQAFLSIWDAQILKPEQIVLVKDGPLSPELDTVIASWQEKLGSTLTVVPLSRNVGLGAALNEGLKYCRYELVARMDTDDVALPKRLATQIKFMQENPDIVASSAILEEWNYDLTQLISMRKLPTKPEDIMTFSLRRSPLSHPLAVFRKDIILSVGGYPPLRKAQDYALWSLLLTKGYKLANLPDVLLKMRAGNEMLARRGFGYFRYECELLRFQRDIGFLTPLNYYLNFIGKAILRLAPRSLQSLAYKFAR
ncbi:glycosyltransferase [Pseudomonas sp. ALS1131]|nr:glycosyltransferase [Pseudomonas sp. ALS1131]TRO40096.1 glycosyltransferase [Pseudomonas sp. ALS1131]